MKVIYNNILETIGNTPVIRLNRMAPEHVDMYVRSQWVDATPA